MNGKTAKRIRRVSGWDLHEKHARTLWVDAKGETAVPWRTPLARAEYRAMKAMHYATPRTVRTYLWRVYL